MLWGCVTQGRASGCTRWVPNIHDLPVLLFPFHQTMLLTSLEGGPSSHCWAPPPEHQFWFCHSDFWFSSSEIYISNKPPGAAALVFQRVVFENHCTQSKSSPLWEGGGRSLLRAWHTGELQDGPGKSETLQYLLCIIGISKNPPISSVHIDKL